MCTLLVAVGVWPDAPLLVAANRDELLARPSSPPRIHGDRTPKVIAPVDEQAGGTWLGLNEYGVFAGITNRFPSQRDPSRASRGALVLEALRAREAREGADRVAALDPLTFNAFHLFVADANGGHLVWSDGSQVHRDEWDEGLRVVTERSLGVDPPVREDWLFAEAARLPRDRAPSPAVLRELLTVHSDAPGERTCVHFPVMGYGTRSSTLVWWSPRGVRFLHAEGPPCTTGYEDFSEMAQSLTIEEEERR